MKKDVTDIQERLRENIRKLMIDRELSQAAIADYMDTTASQLSKIFSGECNFNLRHIANLASALSLREIDIFTYPDVYVKPQDKEHPQEPVEAILQIRLQKEKKEQVLKLVFGENNIEILNK
jgi:transcriptional regulator with XRE-family HTH domain